MEMIDNESPIDFEIQQQFEFKKKSKFDIKPKVILACFLILVLILMIPKEEVKKDEFEKIENLSQKTFDNNKLLFTFEVNRHGARNSYIRNPIALEGFKV